MFRNIWIVAGILALVMLLAPPQANAQIRFGVTIGHPQYYSYPVYTYPSYSYYPYYQTYTPYYGPYYTTYYHRYPAYTRYYVSPSRSYVWTYRYHHKRHHRDR